MCSYYLYWSVLSSYCQWSASQVKRENYLLSLFSRAYKQNCYQFIFVQRFSMLHYTPFAVINKFMAFPLITLVYWSKYFSFLLCWHQRIKEINIFTTSTVYTLTIYTISARTRRFISITSRTRLNQGLVYSFYKHGSI